MKLFKVASASVALAVAATAATPTLAQTSPPVTGPVLPGICVFNEGRAVENSTIGGFLKTRLGQLDASVHAELEAEATQLQTESKALEAKQAVTSKTQFDSEKTAFQAKVQAFQRKDQLRGIQMQLTKGKAVRQIEVALQPVVQQTFQQRGCSVLIAAEALVMYVPGAEITDSAIAGLNVKLTTMPVDLASEQEAMQAVQQQQQQQGR